ncbi:hypothetical protein HCU64_06700 [Methylobacterium sp. C25]|uniref:hypothetical protein n=1 Tax=Methylobacterium sp. C25 TaxID=2721622 RepID=UPI001F240356|nr:hypothetical protein [Methylobacterium sp. C25]MCE4223435.1 hypothetical protein [Methylobacterium sp. C25]
MNDTDSARLDAIETLLGLMLRRGPKEDAVAIIDDLRTTIAGAKRNRQLRKQAVPALEHLEHVLAEWADAPRS